MAKTKKQALNEEEKLEQQTPVAVEEVMGDYVDAQSSIQKYSRAALWLKIGGLVLAALMIILFLLYVFLSLFKEEGSFTVLLSDASQSKGVMISETQGFSNPNVRLSASPVPSAWNITLADIPEDIDKIDGSHNSDNYLAYTFYIKNTGVENIAYNSTMRLDYSELGAEEAIRVMLIEDGKRTIYAKPAKETGAIEAFACDKPFTGDVNLFTFKSKDMAPGDSIKYTVVIWFEGNDPECVNDIIGGTVKMTMLFDIPTTENQ